LHKWRYEDPETVSQKVKNQPWDWAITKYGNVPPPGFWGTVKTKTVFTKRECQRCGIKEQKRFAQDDQGNETLSNWEEIT
jgi:hypothetical protein